MTSTSNSNIVVETIKIVEYNMLVSYHIFVSHYSISDLTVVIFSKKRDTTEQGIEQGIEQGLERGRNEERKELMSMLYKKGYTLKEIAQMTDRKEKEVRETLQLL